MMLAFPIITLIESIGVEGDVVPRKFGTLLESVNISRRRGRFSMVKSFLD